MRSYLAGYELLSYAFGIPELDNSSEEDPIRNIPRHLLVPGGGRDEDEEEEEDEGYDVEADTSTLKLAGDDDAYGLLRTLVRTIESVGFLPTETNENILKKLEQTELVVMPMTDLRLMADALTMFDITDGICTIETTSSIDLTNQINEGNQEQRCELLQRAVDIMRSPFSIALTGVVLLSSGYVKSILAQDGGQVTVERPGGDPVEITIKEVSQPLRARLISVASTIAFICGDSVGAEKCLRESLALDECCVDTKIKLAGVLSDMGEEESAHEIMSELPFSLVGSLHEAELEVGRISRNIIFANSLVR